MKTIEQMRNEAEVLQAEVNAIDEKRFTANKAENKALLAVRKPIANKLERLLDKLFLYDMQTELEKDLNS